VGAYISVNDGWGVGVEILQTLGDIEHETELPSAPTSIKMVFELTSRFSVGQSTLRSLVSLILKVVWNSRCNRTNHRSRIIR